MPMWRKSGSAPKDGSGGSRTLAPQPLRSSPHHGQRWRRLIRSKPCRRSSTATSAPRRRSSKAQRRPTGPAPTITARRPARGSRLYWAAPRRASSRSQRARAVCFCLPTAAAIRSIGAAAASSSHAAGSASAEAQRSCAKLSAMLLTPRLVRNASKSSAMSGRFSFMPSRAQSQLHLAQRPAGQTGSTGRISDAVAGSAAAAGHRVPAGEESCPLAWAGPRGVEQGRAPFAGSRPAASPALASSARSRLSRSHSCCGWTLLM
mmetsp:Transcript_4200/g.12275  ORF Transcript_4200/g.12275 Transcript_4200/m.12275 type:complete len:262 (+) Transcript_4200:678-1463(+)